MYGKRCVRTANQRNRANRKILVHLRIKGRSPILEGIGPSKFRPPSESLDRLSDRRPISLGIEPCNHEVQAAKSPRLVNRPISVGSVPVKKVRLISTCSSCGQSKRKTGKGPSRSFSAAITTLKLDKRDTVEGNFPVNEFRKRLSICRFERLPMTGEIVDENWLDPRLRYSGPTKRRLKSRYCVRSWWSCLALETTKIDFRLTQIGQTKECVRYCSF